MTYLNPSRKQLNHHALILSGSCKENKDDYKFASQLQGFILLLKNNKYQGTKHSVSFRVEGSLHPLYFRQQDII